MNDPVHFLRTTGTLPNPGSHKNGPVVFEILCSVAFTTHVRGTDIRRDVTCEDCLKALKQAGR